MSTGKRPALKPEAAAMRLTRKSLQIKLLVFDVDGTLTDGSLWYGPDGETMKQFHVRDGHGIVMARLANMPTAFLTARTSKILEVRAAELKIAHVMQGQRNKGEALAALCAQLKVAPENCAYMGDDVNDIPAMKLAGFASCPADAVDEVKAVVDYVAAKNGGHGAAREVIELLLKWSQRWQGAMDQMK